MSTTRVIEISSSDDLIDVRDIIARVEELETQRDDEDEEMDGEEVTELATLRELLSDLAGNGGDEDWRGDWYPITLIRESHFENYAQELAEDIGAIDRNASWPNTCIDWEAASEALLMDYTSTEFDGVTYYYR